VRGSDALFPNDFGGGLVLLLIEKQRFLSVPYSGTHDRPQVPKTKILQFHDFIFIHIFILDCLKIGYICVTRQPETQKSIQRRDNGIAMTLSRSSSCFRFVSLYATIHLILYSSQIPVFLSIRLQFQLTEMTLYSMQVPRLAGSIECFKISLVQVQLQLAMNSCTTARMRPSLSRSSSNFTGRRIGDSTGKLLINRVVTN